jgi:hypothetical protein
MRKRCKPDGFHCHHLIPLSVLEKRSFARIFGKARAAGFDPDDFASNGMHLPFREDLAIAFGLPLHRGPHHIYNEIVAEQISGWTRLHHLDLISRLHQLQIELRRGLRRPGVRVGAVEDMNRILYDDFKRIDAAIETLFSKPHF